MGHTDRDMQKRIGLKDLARELGMDVSTVSRALRQDPRVRAETRQSVRALADRLGYRPNAAARALKGGMTDRVAVLLSPPQQRFASPIFLELLATLDQRLRATGKTLAVFAAQSRDEEAGIVQMIVEDGLADGIVLGRTRAQDPRVAYLLKIGTPFVSFGRTDWPDRHPWVEIDYAAAGALAVAALAEAGPKRLAILSAPEGLNFADNYLAGALAEAETRGLPEPQVVRCEMTEEAGEAAARAIFDAGTDRLAVACIQDSLAFGLYRAAAARGLTVGGDIAVIGGQNFPGSEHAAPPLSTFSTEDSRVAALLSDVMLARLDTTPEDPPETHVIAPQPLLRGSHLLP
ncbi:LacI family transcriptional regulator [Rhodobacteraceae bacterium CCMM004]|nr:LacI family transcriptional regulator [Rhodobacteraceae bacterium CCMM004]